MTRKKMSTKSFESKLSVLVDIFFVIPLGFKPKTFRTGI